MLVAKASSTLPFADVCLLRNGMHILLICTGASLHTAKHQPSLLPPSIWEHELCSLTSNGMFAGFADYGVNVNPLKTRLSFDMTTSNGTHLQVSHKVS